MKIILAFFRFAEGTLEKSLGTWSKYGKDNR